MILKCDTFCIEKISFQFKIVHSRLLKHIIEKITHLIFLWIDPADKILSFNLKSPQEAYF